MGKFLFGVLIGAAITLGGLHVSERMAPPSLPRPDTARNPQPFADNLKAAILASPAHAKIGAAILKVIDSPDSPRRTRILGRMERHAAVALDSHVGEIDWSSVNWGLVLSLVVHILILLLPLL